MKAFYGILISAVVLLSAPPLVRGDEVEALTTTWIPYAYEENGEITGLSTEIVQAILTRANLHGPIQLSSWNRAIITAKTQKNILISPLIIKELDNARTCTIGVLKGAAMHRFLRSQGFKDNLQLQVSNRKNIELLFRGRIDLVADNPLVVSHEVKQLARSGIKDIDFSMDKVQKPFARGRRIRHDTLLKRTL